MVHKNKKMSTSIFKKLKKLTRIQDETNRNNGLFDLFELSRERERERATHQIIIQFDLNNQRYESFLINLFNICFVVAF